MCVLGKRETTSGTGYLAALRETLAPRLYWKRVALEVAGRSSKSIAKEHKQIGWNEVEDIKAKLEEEKLEATWHALKPHWERGALIWVSQDLSLSDVGVSLAQDQASVVEGWLGEGLLAKPSEEQMKEWNENPLKLFWMSIVQPFVLIQELSDEEEVAFFQRKLQA